jgi:hypothetical protein
MTLGGLLILLLVIWLIFGRFSPGFVPGQLSTVLLVLLLLFIVVPMFAGESLGIHRTFWCR